MKLQETEAIMAPMNVVKVDLGGRGRQRRQHGGSRPLHLTLLWVAGAVTLFGPGASALGAMGPGAAIKIGAQTLDSPIDGDKITRARIELEICSPLLVDGHVDFALAVGGSSLGTSRYEDVYTEGGVLYEDYYKDEYSSIDVRAAVRLYPLDADSVIRPYVGAGLGYFWLRDEWHDKYYTTFEDPDFPGVYYTYEDRAHDEETIAKGFFPYVTAGLAASVTSHIEVLFDFQYDMAKEDGPYDLSGPNYMFGVRFRF
jgi:hypothetical protein